MLLLNNFLTFTFFSTDKFIINYIYNYKTYNNLFIFLNIFFINNIIQIRIMDIFSFITHWNEKKKQKY